MRFAAVPAGLAIIDRGLVFAEYWTHPEDQIAEWRHKSIKCAEVLVPDRVPYQHIEGVYVSCQDARSAVLEYAGSLPVTVDAHLFFQERRCELWFAYCSTTSLCLRPRP